MNMNYKDKYRSDITFDDLDDLEFDFQNENNKFDKHIINNISNYKFKGNRLSNTPATITTTTTTTTTTNKAAANSTLNNNDNSGNKLNIKSSLFKTPTLNNPNTITPTTTIASSTNDQLETPKLLNNSNSNRNSGSKFKTPNTCIPKMSASKNELTSSSVIPPVAVSASATSKSKTPMKQTAKDYTYFALTENKSKEIGFASYHTNSGQFEIGQFCDSQTYVHLYTKLFILQVSLIITPPLNDDSELLKMIMNKFPNVEITTIPRKIFNENNGISLIKQYSTPDKLLLLERNVTSKYLAQASFSALIKYLEGVNDITFSNSCLSIFYSSSERIMQIDAESIKNLELVRNSLNGSRESTLFSSLNHTKTPQGARLLIRNLVQPPNDMATIRMRQESIKEILSNERSFFTIGPILSKFKDLDQMLVNFTLKTDFNSMSITKIQKFIKSIIEFKNIIDLLPKLHDSLSNMKTPLLKAIYENISNLEIKTISDETVKYFNERLPSNKSSLANNIVYSIKDGINGLLDVCKKTYNEILNDINKLVTHYQDQYKMPGIKLHHNTGKGFHLSIYCKNRSLMQLPSIFIRATFKKNKCEFVTDDLVSLSRRVNEVFDEIVLLTSISVSNLIDFYRERISSLFNVSESISLLDLLFSLGSYVTLNDTVCPQFYEKGPLAIKQGYHPFYLYKSSKNRLDNDNHNYFVPNDTMLTQTANFHILHGPNMSGKTTYIEQVALLSILAHIGSYVPAKFMSCPIITNNSILPFDKIFTRIGTSDNLQSNASTFMTEMTEISYVLECATDRSLVIVDELGRGTSNIEGSSIAWAISEKIANIGCMTLFVTHYQELLGMSFIYPMIRNYHLSVTREDDQLKYGYSLSESVSTVHRYGIDIAMIAGIDEQVIQIARSVSDQLDLQQKDQDATSKDQQQTVHPARTAFQLVQKLLNLEHSNYNDQQITDYIADLREQYSIDLNSQLLK
ncbi:DNA mismatch repair protein [Heterostelium album PN500]|uniref:DNA mismatch repair protein n=1 Tax=Heterostelium pallidum (strain ATCC 26659 / Pp 5 / PN500) TaxID=670386 RepID=D3BPU0_HETP5|nr:DNA mismatch repair protein [Heterostelium album PN500]EFA76223.1 DNA mismatch repair protein [Heterostelium album PN500]|eukprot:XP_020428356.1 DNA mismatch repair protein [Heterostelium album PN500]